MNPPTRKALRGNLLLLLLLLLSSNKSSFDQVRIGECSNKWQIITWLALRGLREGKVSGAAESVDHTAQHTVSSSVWHATRQLWLACCTFVLMIRQLSSLKMYCAKKIVVIFMRRNCYLAICRTELFRLDATRLASACVASNCSWCWAGDEGIVCRMACSSFINCRLSLPRPPSPSLSLNLQHMSRQAVCNTHSNR